MLVNANSVKTLLTHGNNSNLNTPSALPDNLVPEAVVTKLVDLHFVGKQLFFLE